MHVDGFRFDLGTTLARPAGMLRRSQCVSDACIQDPLLAHVKLIAEPWDCGPGGYQMGRFPPGWAEWNDKFRDAVRDFWRGAALGRRAGSRSVRVGGRLRSSRPQALGERQLRHGARRVHAERRGQLRRQAQRGQRRRTTATAAPTTGRPTTAWKGRPTIPRSWPLRARQMRNMLATLLCSQGTPMVLAGDEFGRTQGGNNNAYCQDNETSWVDWEPRRAASAN